MDRDTLRKLTAQIPTKIQLIQYPIYYQGKGSSDCRWFYTWSCWRKQRPDTAEPMQSVPHSQPISTFQDQRQSRSWTIGTKHLHLQRQVQRMNKLLQISTFHQREYQVDRPNILLLREPSTHLTLDCRRVTGRKKDLPQQMALQYLPTIALRYLPLN